jgi:hypothetical protein
MMKKLTYILFALFVLSACSEDTTEYKQRKEELENANAAKQSEIARQQEELRKKKEEAEKLKQRLEELERIKSGIVPEPQLLTMEFKKADNAGLSGDVTCEVYSSNGIVNCWLPDLDDPKKLVPRFTFDGTLMMMGSTEVTSGSTAIDFTEPVTMTVTTSKGTKDYVVNVYSYTGLPVMRIDTEGGRSITSKETYLNAHMKLTEDVKTRGGGDVLEADLLIKGRGNSTWLFKKKPYRLKFNEKVSLLGEHKDRSWVLLANYADKSVLRTHAAFYMGKISNLEYTSSSHFVELFLNGKYDGTYELCEKIKVSNHRVAVGDDGFLLEIDAEAEDDSDSRYFYVYSLSNPVNIKEPDVQYNDANYNYIENFLEKVDNALYGLNFRNTSTGWQAYMDMDSFVDWYLINEISHNTDSRMFKSCFMSLKRGGKLKMGPLWDFDLAFGNTDYWDRGPEGFWVKDADWFERLFEDPAFVNRVKERFDYFYNHLPDILNEIDAEGQYLKYSMVANENRWHSLYAYSVPNVEIWGSYQNEVQSVKEWLKKRMDWLKKQYDRM